MQGGTFGSTQPEGERPPGESSKAGPGGDRRLGDYVLLEAAGTGGTGVVHRAWQLSLHRFVAIKLVDRNTGVDADRVLREARMAAKLSHPHIVPIYEVGQQDGRLYLAMKFIAGQSMDRIRVTPRHAVELMCQAASAIDYAHRNGVIHRDLKPHNLLLEGDEHVWVSDFGVARSSAGGSTLTGTGRVVGTPAYMSPEQARGQRCDERSDVYSLGATLYDLVTGRHPYEGTDDVLVVMTQVLSAEPVPPRRLNPDVPADVEVIIGKAMAKDPARRYQSARELEDDLRRHLAGEPIKAKPPGPVVRAIKWVKRHPVLAAALGFALAAGVGAWFHTLSLRRQLAETTLAEANALGSGNQWQAARARYTRAARAFEALGMPSVAPDLGLLDAHHHAPPPLLALRGHSATVRKVAFLPDGRQALSVSDDQTMRLWDVPRGRSVRTFVGHEDAVAALALSGDGRIAITGGHDGTVRVWQVDTGRAVQVLPVEGGAALSVALSPDARHALSRAADGTVQLWDLATGQVLRRLVVAVKRVTALAFSPDGRLALTGRNIEEKGALINTRASLWEVDTGREVQTFGGFVAELSTVVFSADGHRILTAGYDRVASVWDVPSGQRLLSLTGHLHGLTGAVFSPRDRIIVSAGQDDTVKLWDADDGNLVRSFDTGGSVDALAVSPDGRFILTGGDDSALKLWDLTVGEEARTFSGHQGAALGLDFSPDGRLAASGGLDRRVRLWDVATGREIRSFAHESAAHALAFSPDGTLVASAGVGGHIKVWDLGAGKELLRLGPNAGTVRSLAFSPDGGRVLASDDRGAVKLWDLARGKPVRVFKQDDEVRRAVLSPDGREIFSGSFDGSARFWDVETGTERGVLRPEPRQQIGTVALSRDGRLAATGDERRAIRLWDAITLRPVRVLEGHRGDLRAIRFSPGGDLLLSASRDRTVRVWDLANGNELHAFNWASAAIRSFAASRDGRYALSGSDDGSLNLLDFTYVRQFREREAGLAEIQARLQAAPADPNALARLGEWYAFRGVSGWASELLSQARAAGATVSPLVLARCHWQEGDLAAARRELVSADARGEAPAAYLTLLVQNLGLADQTDLLSQINLRDGRVRFPFLGIRSGGVGPAPRRGLANPLTQPPWGALITRVFPRSPAQRAGLRVGDVIVRAGDQGLGNDAKLGSFLSSQAAGARVVLTFVREGKNHTTEAVLTDRPSELWERSRRPVREPRSGYSFQTLTPELATSFGLDPATQGAVVSDTGTHPPIEIANLLFVEDVVITADGEPIGTAEDAARALGQLPLERWSRLGLIRPGNVR